MTRGNKFFFYYATLASILISFSGFASSKNTGQLLFQFLFLPITLYFVIALVTRSGHSTFAPPHAKRFFLVSLIVFLIFFATSLYRLFTNPQTPPPKAQTTTGIKLTPSTSASPSATPEETPPPPTTPTVTFDLSDPDNRANIREEPSTDSPIILKANADDSFPLVSENENWYQILLPDDSTGWVSTDIAIIK